MDLLTPELGLFFWTLIAFLVVFFILGKFAWKPILGILSEREKGITEAIASAEKMKGEMSQMKSENEKLMAQAHEERTAMLKEAKDIKDRIIGEAKEIAKTEANKIIIEAQAQINQQKNAAMTEVKNEIGTLALEVAEKILRKQLNSNEGQEAYMNMLANDIKLN
ncbi:ATP synthase F0 subunit B [Flavipsychrobacter stenotrophus]|uniref:ATP synthase subunit b n=1 Tax=Flavipsychrobacter stenotrophus TaxID=2077091 RepID=A0A2S7SXL7_9BACT|nr:F0F1 ATP synthase subunit B [Flavipsychrobacter stenotrophus]PQJ11458.1 ATP synthase F0 subunit B [Flavipsychrobacter stenotrophus]